MAFPVTKVNDETSLNKIEKFRQVLQDYFFFTSKGMCFPGVAGTPVMKSLVINVLITTDRWHDGMWSIGSRSK